MLRVLLKWFRRQRRPVILAVVFISVFELWRLDIDVQNDESQPRLKQESVHPVTRLRRFRDFLLSDGENDPHQLDAQLEKHHPRHEVRVPSTSPRPPRTVATRQHPEDDIVVDTSGAVINPHPFNYTINCPELCRGANVFLLNYVHTAVDHFGRRARIRKTWAMQSHYRNFTIRTVFFVGFTNKSAWLQEAIEYEAILHNDIVQENFLDTYRNLSYKGVAALKWITTYCKHAAYIMKCDDDVFVNMFALLKHLNDLYVHDYRRRLIICLVWRRMHVLREGRWGIPKEDIPDDLYPVYCSGMGFVLSTDAAVAMYRVSFYVKFQWVDDAFITGYLPRALRGAVSHSDMGRAYCGAKEMAVYWHDTEWYKYIFTHVHDEQLYRSTWQKLVEVAASKPIPTPAVVRPGELAEQYIRKAVLFPELEKERQLRRKMKMEKKKNEEAKQRGDAKKG